MSITDFPQSKPSHAASSQQSNSLQLSLDELRRKLARMTDEGWAKDLELKELRAAQAEKDTTIARLSEECAIHSRNLRELIERLGPMEAQFEESQRSLREARQEHIHELEHLNETNVALKNQVSMLLTERNKLLADFDRVRKEKDQQSQQSQRLIEEVRGQQNLAIQKLDKSSAEIIRIQKALNEQTSLVAELRRALEKETLSKEQFEARSKSQEEEIANLRNLDSENKNAITRLESQSAEQAKQIEQARDVVAAFEQALQSSKIALEDCKIQAAQNLRETNLQHSQRFETLLNQQNQLNCEIASLRAKNSALEKRAQEASEQNEKIRNERKALEIEMQKHLMQREQDFKSRYDEVLSENEGLRQALESQQSIRLVADNIIREKAELMRLAKLFVSEIQMVRTAHPLKDYMGLTDLEISKLQSQLKNTGLNPAERARLEDMSSKMLKKREFLNSVLAQSQKQLEERAQSVLNIAHSDPNA